MHVPLFSWSPAFGADEAGQIIAGRVMMTLVAIGTAVAVYSIARKFMPSTAAPFGATLGQHPVHPSANR